MHKKWLAPMAVGLIAGFSNNGLHLSLGQSAVLFIACFACYVLGQVYVALDK